LSFTESLAAPRVAVPAFRPLARLDAPVKIPYSRIHHMQKPLKPPALRPGDAIRILSLASPVKEDFLEKGCAEIKRLGYVPKLDRTSVLAKESFFAGSAEDRSRAFDEALRDHSRAIFCTRGGYGSNYVLDRMGEAADPKILLGSSDITSLQIYCWQKFGWVTFYGPMVASNFCHGDSAPHGYDRASLLRALTETKESWSIDLRASDMSKDIPEGVLLGGCLTLIEETLGTPWELDTRGAILVLEDRGMKPYQVDRALMHLKQAGKFAGVQGIILGEFPDCDAAPEGETVQSIARRILAPLGLPTAWGAPVGHTARQALTLPLGVHAQISSVGSGVLRILEPACVA
jgi:muramoyltetrapeptide carboxypeptidase